MNQTKITNIIERGGVEGWNDGDNLDALTKTFEFDSFEQGQAFVQAVSKFCEQKDHHPEWSCSDGGKKISVRLTSHFANNKVTLFDFELAEHMNFQYGETRSSFRQFPRITERNLVSLSVGVGTFVLAYSLWQYFTAPHYYSDDVQRGKPINQEAASNLALSQHPNQTAREHE
jgi:4a-hydroxytetrahydrobiopterin dehydratase